MAILFIKPSESTFINKDEHFLRQDYHTKVHFYRYGNFIRHLVSQMLLKLWLLKNIFTANILFIWFADYHAFLPIFFGKLFRKKSILALGGYDVNSIPELNYGVFTKRLRGWCARYALRNADFLLPVVNSLQEEIKRRVAKIKGKIQVVPFGFDAGILKADGRKRKTETVLTVASVSDPTRMKIKGVDFFVQVAAAMPGVQFAIIGVDGEARAFVENQKSPNLTVIGKLDYEDLIEHFQKAKVYAQFSLIEGLPNAVCEAMLCECIPVGTNIGGIPEAVGDCGFILENKTVGFAASAIKQALAADETWGKKARERIVQRFSEEKRHQALKAIIASIEK